ncbi:MAG: hypothetical protein CM1200mP38_2890 [Dehalococcoidia bacterium]|nr:MAG: hypothetical protein CM1200mP38_2890 [Dehalococcoidia bacterium]
MAASAELLMAYISLELLSFGLYVLVAFDRYNKESNEAGLKLILLGAFSSQSFYSELVKFMVCLEPQCFQELRKVYVYSFF